MIFDLINLDNRVKLPLEAKHELLGSYSIAAELAIFLPCLEHLADQGVIDAVLYSVILGPTGIHAQSQIPKEILLTKTVELK